ncbi:GNAT family N-acetyltransferase [Pseudoroseicyclus aestuarii]|uniref:Ribosomal-protein-alanine N-acetyltransferase n=1 Tax=Pseudoroseicyclus aestuarii TaxID=1795041 RepID=A0A318SWM0_9RHOB|nr:GNAT family N-acetyltransferase [Pseudoroseicyclus aestuarii]PYE84776.1 ribosomal-protein-alanine N-acetyltransferase [Pseudoroseicyclus aestuarii]
MTPPALRPEALAETHARAFAPERGWSAEEFAQLLAAPGAIAAGDAQAFVIGRAVLDEAEIVTLATDPVQRRQGRASAALAAFEEVAARAGVRSVFLEVAEDNAAAGALYRAAGYDAAGRRRRYYARPGGAVDAVVMRKELPPCPGVS